MTQPVAFESGPAQTRRAVLDARNIRLARGGAAFARLPALALDERRTVALTGASGCGKTTALLALAGIRAPASGTVTIESRDLWALRAPARDRFRGRRIGLVFQSFHLIDAVSVRRNLTLAATSAGLKPDAAHIAHLMERLGIAALAARRADQLSTGQAQRVALARALVNKPALVLADEPTSALDDANAKALLALLRDTVTALGGALLVATHDRRVLDGTDGVIAMESIP